MINTCALVTHHDPEVAGDAARTVVRLATEMGIQVVAGQEEIDRHQLGSVGVLEIGSSTDIDLWMCLGGDGTILRGLRSAAPSPVPVYGINFGEVGFLAARDPEEGFEEAVGEALRGEFDVIGLPALRFDNGSAFPAFNDVSLQRRPGLRVADIAYLVGGEEVGRVRCDGVVLATPAGSTGYNLANGGPVVAWGVSGYAVSFIAPHSLTARALLVAPDDRVELVNRSSAEPVDLAVDGRPYGELAAGASIEVSYQPAAGLLAQNPGSSFYHRLRQKFGRLAS
jgi:NAD+ kinase